MFVDKSINLCLVDGVEAVGLLYGKLRNPDFPIKVGSFACSHITEAIHMGDGILVFEVADDAGNRITFSFAPDTTPFAESAFDADDRPICSNC